MAMEGKAYVVSCVGKYAFYNCKGLTSISIPHSVNRIGESAFSGCSGLISVHISDLAGWCNIVFEDDVNDQYFCLSNPLSAAHHLYINGEEVMDLNIPNSVTFISDNAFMGCSSFISVNIPNSVTTIGSFAFYGCSGLTSVTIPNNVTYIGEDVFSNCISLTSVRISN